MTELTDKGSAIDEPKKSIFSGLRLTLEEWFNTFLLANPNTNFGRTVQFLQALLIAALALACILVQVYTDVTRSGGKQLAELVELDIASNVYDVIHLLMDEQGAYLQSIGSNQDEGSSKTDGPIRATDTKLILIDDWLRPDDLLMVSSTMRSLIATTTNLSLTLRQNRAILKNSKSISEMDVLGFYYSLISSLFSATKDLSNNMARFQGWGDLRAYHHINQAEVDGDVVYQLSRISVRQRELIPLGGNSSNHRLSSGVIGYEGYLELASHDSVYSQEALAGNLSKTDTVTHFATIYDNILRSKYETVTLNELDEAWLRVKASLVWFEAHFKERVVNAISRISTWPPEAITSVILLTVSSTIAFASIFIHLQAVFRLQNYIRHTYATIDLLAKTYESIYEHVPTSYVALIRENRRHFPPQFIEDVCVAIIDVPIFRHLLQNDKELGVAQLCNIFEKYSVALESTLAKYVKSSPSLCKVDVIGEYCCLASGVFFNSQMKRTHHSMFSNDHVSEMLCAMLELIDRVSKEVILNDPNDGDQKEQFSSNLINVRVGIHVGAALCDISYLRSLPRLAIYGEAMDLATLVHATSLPLLVQVSEQVVKRYESVDNPFNFFKHGTLDGKVGLFWARWADESDNVDAEGLPFYGDNDDSASVVTF